jgi:hypothetical protein
MRKKHCGPGSGLFSVLRRSDTSVIRSSRSVSFFLNLLCCTSNIYVNKKVKNSYLLFLLTLCIFSMTLFRGPSKNPNHQTGSRISRKPPTRPEVGKMKIVYLLPLSLPSALHVGNIVYLKKRVGSCGFCLLP